MSDPFLARFGLKVLEGPVRDIKWTNPAEDFPPEPNPFDPALLARVNIAPEDMPDLADEYVPLQFDPSDDGIPRCADCKLEILDDEWVDIDDPADGSKRTVHRGCAPSIHLPPADVPPPRPRGRRR